MYLEVTEEKYLKMRKRLEESNITFKLIKYKLPGSDTFSFRFDFGETNKDLARKIHNMYCDLSEEMGETVVRNKWLDTLEKIKEQERERQREREKGKEDRNGYNYL